MSEIQSLSICCPSSNGCINNCKPCCSKQHKSPYKNKYGGSHVECIEYWDDVIKRMRYAQNKGITTIILTGSNEPQQDRRWIEGLYLAMKALPEPFINIEMQTTGAFLDMDYLSFLKMMGVTTIAISTFSLTSDEDNRNIEGSADKNLNLAELCNHIYSLGMNIRICLNMTDYIADRIGLNDLFRRCKEELHANQITFRKMWSNFNTEESKWIQDNCLYVEKYMNYLTSRVECNGMLLDTLPYGAKRYDYFGLSVVIDTDCMAKDTENTRTRYYIIRENGKMYSSWDSEASIIF